jgi:hypothetical protein
MTFLNPFALLGLAAAAIPIILHLLNLRKLKTVEFSSLQFLKELQKSTLRRVKIRQLLLLLIRTLLIVALVFAFSRPALQGSLAGTIGTHAKTTMVILLDDSPSMAVRNEHGVIFAQAKEAAARILTLAQEGDEVQLLRLSEVPRLSSPPAQAELLPHQSAGMLTSALATMKVSPSTVPMREALGSAAKLLSLSKNFNQEIYLMTDGQATLFASSTTNSDSSSLFESRARFFLVQFPGTALGNIGITSAAVTSRIVTTAKPAEVEATVWNYSDTPLQNSLLNVYLDGSRLLQQSMTIAAGGSMTYSLAVTPKRRGILRGYLQLEDDPMELDNTRYFVLDVPEGISVLLVGNTPSDTRFPALALTLRGDTSMADLFAARRVSEQELSALSLNKYDVLILCNVSRLSDSEAERITQYVRSGNGLMIFPGDSTRISDLNKELFARLGIPAAGEPTGSSAPAGEQSFLSFGKVDYAHPLFTGLFERAGVGPKKTPAIESPRVFRAILPGQTERSQAIITLTDGRGFLTEYLLGTGRVLLWSVTADVAWSDFPVKGVFAPLMHRATLYLGAHNEQTASYTVGAPLTFILHRGAAANPGRYVLRSPAGVDERIAPRVNAASGVVTFESGQTTELGFYELRRATREAATAQSATADLMDAAAVNLSPSESDLRPVTDDELASFWRRIGVAPEQTKRVAPREAIDKTVMEARLGVELWKYFIGIAVILALLEMAIGREPKRQEAD